MLISKDCAFVCAHCGERPVFTRQRESGAIQWFDLGDAVCPTDGCDSRVFCASSALVDNSEPMCSCCEVA